MLQINMNRKGLFLIAIILLASLAFIFSQCITGEDNRVEDDLFFGVSYGGQASVEDAKILIDRVKNYTNFFLVNSYDLTTNETALNEVCNYAAQANLKFIVYFDFISRIAYPWHQTWLDTASARWGDNFLGIHLSDEPGGKQIDTQKYYTKAANYSDAANRFVNNISSTNSMVDAKNKSIPLFTSDYALYWWDYLAGYDTVFAELGWNLSSNQQIALCRGAANMQGKDWGAIIVWKYYSPPYLGNASEIYGDMVSAYRAGAKYVVVFDYPTYPETNPYGILSEEHLAAMEQFWNYVKTTPRDAGGKVKGEVALVLPKDYGWGMRRTAYITHDRIWGVFPEDEKAPLILNNTAKLLDTYGLKLDVIYGDARFGYKSKYRMVYFWNSTIP
jgi:hypothetical protein